MASAETDAGSLRPVSIIALQEHVKKLSVLRHGVENYDELEQVAGYIERFFDSLGMKIQNQCFQFRGRQYRNIMACIPGSHKELPCLLVGAHYDGNRKTPGADDNASGVAVMLETARILREVKPLRTLEFAAFTLEEPQDFTHIIRRGSRFFVREARRERVEYEGAVILECVGYTTPDQKGAALAQLTGVAVPPQGDFLAVVGNGPSKPFMDAFVAAANKAAPALRTVGYAAPAQGYLLPQTRFSDHSSFWERDYRAIMLNDTVMFRNPNYHQPTDTPDTLNYQFMTGVAEAVVAFLGSYGFERSS